MKYLYILLSVMLCSLQIWAQQNTQNIRGTIFDKQSQSPIKGAQISIADTLHPTTTVSDAKGNYVLTSINPGRYEVKITFEGYKDVVMPNVVVNSGKETILDINMEEKIKQMKSATVRGNNKTKPINDLASISARTFSTEEVNRYAGGRSDPARLAANFAGVSAPDDSRNDIVIRGNSPTGVLWRIEGMNVPNPNHFATVGTTGGPVAALNTNMLKNSDFFTSAFPAEYGNANAGVFDIGFRKGNSEKREHTIQFGMLTGMEAMTEGPLKKGNGSSYLVAYRYSFTGIAQKMGLSVGTAATPFYQDISFKVVSGESKYGRFTLFGLGGNSHIDFLHNKIDSTDLFADPTSDSYFTSDIGVIGLKHFIKINDKSYINTVIGANYSASNFLLDTINKTNDDAVRAIENKSNRLVYNLNTAYNNKINARLFIKAGLQADIMNLNLQYRVRRYEPEWKQYWAFDGTTTLAQAYVHGKYSFSDKTVLNAGLHSQLLTLNNAIAIEPRIGLKHSISNKSTLSVGYGLHSQMQALDVYFYRQQLPDGSYDNSNEKLGFTKSHHFVAGYDYLPKKDWRIKTEVYYQYLYNIPVTATSSSFSMLNNGSGFIPVNQGNLQNKGTGTNYGVELTVEKFYSRGYYGLLTGSLYESKYKGSDGIEHRTAFNGRYVANLLIGKEYKVGKDKRNRLYTDIKVTSAGGRYYTPIDLIASQQQNQQITMGDAYAFSARNPNFFRMDIKTGYTFNSAKRKLSQSFYFDIQNVTNHKNVFAERYNTVSGMVNTAYQIGFFPNFVYKLQF